MSDYGIAGIPYEEIEPLRKKMKKQMNTKRYRHTVGVEYTAVSLAMRYGADLRQAALAGLLHDCAKCLGEQEILKECTRYNISYNGTEARQPYLLHAKLGAYYAREKYGIGDSEICSAIRYHTTGRAGMALLEKIIFTADYIEPHRKMLDMLPAIRQMAFIDLEEAVYMILHETISYLEESSHHKKQEIEQHTLQAYEYYKMLHNRNSK